MSCEDVASEQGDLPRRNHQGQRAGGQIAKADQVQPDQVQSDQVQSDQVQLLESRSLADRVAGTLTSAADCHGSVCQQEPCQQDQSHQDQSHQDQSHQDQSHQDQCHPEQCEEALSHLDEFVDGEVDPQRHLNIAAHLHDCSPCQQQYALEAVVKSLVARSCAEHAPPALRARVVAQLVIARWRITS